MPTKCQQIANKMKAEWQQNMKQFRANFSDLKPVDQSFAMLSINNIGPCKWLRDSRISSFLIMNYKLVSTFILLLSEP